jgi:hypothetical protein
MKTTAQHNSQPVAQHSSQQAGVPCGVQHNIIVKHNYHFHLLTCWSQIICAICKKNLEKNRAGI